MDSPTCPACRSESTTLVRTHPAELAAEHFVPKQRSPERHAQLVAHLTHLWVRPSVDIVSCDRCGMVFSWPWVGGDEIFYKLVHGGANLYPGDRWEFRETIDALKGRAGRLLELGPGKGAFIHKLREAVGSRFDVVAADFDEGAVAELRSAGITAIRGSLTDVAASDPEPFDVVCMFQTFEHIASTDRWFAELRGVMRSGGSVFLSVPHGPWITVQEELTGYWDMPPNHVGRWTQQALDAVAVRAGFQVVEQRLMPVDVVTWTRELAVWRVCGQAYKRGTLAQRIQSTTYRPVRGLLKQALGVAYMPSMFAKRHRFASSVLLAHLRLGENELTQPLKSRMETRQR